MHTTNSTATHWALKENFAEYHLQAIRQRNTELTAFAEISQDLQLRVYQVLGRNRVEDTFINTYIRPYLHRLSPQTSGSSINGTYYKLTTGKLLLKSLYSANASIESFLKCSSRYRQSSRLRPAYKWYVAEVTHLGRFVLSKEAVQSDLSLWHPPLHLSFGLKRLWCLQASSVTSF